MNKQIKKEMNKHVDLALWLLLRIKFLNDLASLQVQQKTKYTPRFPTHRNIWQGSYDVISCEQDQIDQIEIPKKRMKEAENAGLIISENVIFPVEPHRKQYSFEVWRVTDLGNEFLNIHQIMEEIRTQILLGNQFLQFLKSS